MALVYILRAQSQKPTHCESEEEARKLIQEGWDNERFPEYLPMYFVTRGALSNGSLYEALNSYYWNSGASMCDGYFPEINIYNNKEWYKISEWNTGRIDSIPISIPISNDAINVVQFPTPKKEWQPTPEEEVALKQLSLKPTAFTVLYEAVHKPPLKTYKAERREMTWVSYPFRWGSLSNITELDYIVVPSVNTASPFRSAIQWLISQGLLVATEAGKVGMWTQYEATEKGVWRLNYETFGHPMGRADKTGKQYHDVDPKPYVEEQLKKRLEYQRAEVKV